MTIREEIIAAEARRFSALRRAVPDELRECLDEDLIYVHSNGLVEDREAFIAPLVSGERKYLSFSPGERTVHAIGEVATCIGDLWVESHAGRIRLRYTALYRRSDSWKMVRWHSCAMQSG